MTQLASASVNLARANPYVGPRSFVRGESLYGRDREVSELLDLVVAERIVFLYSPSGAGKTSLLQAGVIPALERDGFFVFPVIRVSHELTPEGLTVAADNRYRLSMLLSLQELVPPDQQLPLEQLVRIGLDEYLSRYPLLEPDCPGGVLVFDQFEELLTLDPTDHLVKAAFLREVGLVLRKKVWSAVFSMREDFIAGLDPYLELIPTRLRTRFRLELLNRQAALLAIRAPAHHAGVEFSDDAASQLVDDLRRVRVQRSSGAVEEVGPHIEPVQLQVVCERLWDRLPPDAEEIAVRDVQGLGDVDRALAGYYAQRVATIAEETGARERALRSWFSKNLITEQGFRNQTLQGPLGGSAEDMMILRRLVDAHLIRGESRRGAIWYELAHDRLIAPVQADNDAWEEAHLSSLQQAAALWESQERNDGLLLAGDALAEAEAWAAANPEELTQADKTFLGASRRQRGKQRRERLLTRITAILLLITAITSVMAFNGWNKALRAQRVSESRDLVDASREASETDPNLSLLLALEAARKSGKPTSRESREALAALADAAFRPGLTLTIPHPKATHVDFHPASGLVLTGSVGELRTWTGTTAVLEKKLSLPDGEVTAAAFSGDGTRVLGAASTEAGELKWQVWDAETREVIGSWPEEPGNQRSEGSERSTGSASISHDGAQVVTATGSSLTVWKLEPDVTPVDKWHLQVPAPEGSEADDAGLTAVGIGADRSVIAGAASGRLWRWPEGGYDEPPVEMGTHDGGVAAITFSDDGRRLATAGADGARTWDLDTGRPERWFRPPFAAVQAVAFGPDGRLVTGDDQGRVLVWDAGSGMAMASFETDDLHEITSVSVSADGKVAAASRDGVPRVWAVEQASPRHAGPVTAVAWSPDGRLLATGSSDGNAALWDARSGEHLRSLGHEGEVRDVAFSPEGTHLATAGDGSARVWAVASGRQVHRLDHDEPVTLLAYNSDATRLATASEDNAVTVWDTGSGRRLFSLTDVAELSETSGLSDVVFSADGRFLATAGWDGSAHLWEAQTGRSAGNALVLEKPAQPEGEDNSGATGAASVLVGDEAENVALHEPLDEEFEEELVGPALPRFSPDGSLLATWSTSQVVIKKVGSWEEVARFEASDVSSLDFSADGTLLSTASRAGATIWKVFSADRPLVIPAARTFTALALSPDGRRLSIGTGAGGWVAFDGTSGAEEISIPPLRSGHRGLTTGAAFSPDGQWVATAGRDGRGFLWRLDERGRSQHPVALGGHTAALTDVVFDASGEFVATAAADGTARTWNVRTGKQVQVFHHGQGGGNPLYDLKVAFGPEGTLATGATDGTAKVWKLASGRATHSLPAKGDASSRTLLDVGFLRGALVTVTTDGWSSWDLASKEPAPSRQRFVATMALLSRDGHRVAVASEGEDDAGAITVKVHQMDDGHQTRLDPLQLDGDIFRMAFNADGSRLGIVDDYGKARVADVGALGEPLAVTTSLKASSIALSDDGGRFLLVDDQGRLHVLPLDPKELKREAQRRLLRWWSQAECKKHLHDDCPPAPRHLARKAR